MEIIARFGTPAQALYCTILYYTILYYTRTCRWTKCGLGSLYSPLPSRMRKQTRTVTCPGLVVPANQARIRVRVRVRELKTSVLEMMLSKD